MKTNPKHTTRESWLSAAVDLCRPAFDGALEGIEIRASCGWPPTRASVVDGICHPADASAEGVTEIYISPHLDDTETVLAALLHELIHATGVRGHGPDFRARMPRLGLDGRPTATEPGLDFGERWARERIALGPYPHARVTLPDAAKKQGTRMLKIECPACGYAARTTAKWIAAGLPTCPCGVEMALTDPPADTTPEEINL